MTFLNNINWRYATKEFSGQKVEEGVLSKIREAIRMAPSSFGLQPYHIIEVVDPAIRARLQEKSWGQSQITQASNLFVFCIDNRVEKRIDEYFVLASGGSAEIREKLAGYEKVMRGFATGLDTPRINSWAGKQAYIALGFAMAACAELQVDSCPMEGFLPEGYREVLGLPDYMSAVVVLAIGYRKSGDPLSPESMPKVRFPESDLFSKK